jgi:RimJ/RimL family protein N-acetyltransferase
MSEANQERSEESMTQLETHRLILRAVVPDDAKDLHEVFKDAEAMRYWYSSSWKTYKLSNLHNQGASHRIKT